MSAGCAECGEFVVLGLGLCIDCLLDAERERLAAAVEASIRPQEAFPLNPDGYIAFNAEANAKRDAARLIRSDNA